mgnify:CR=1 FL=1
MAGGGEATGSSMQDYVRSLPYVVIWIFFSSSTILFNKWVLASTEFTFPIALSCWHMLFASVLTHGLARTTTVITPPEINREFYMYRVLPIALAFGVSLITANSAYMYLSVAFIQMIKACTPMVVLLLSFGAKLEQPSLALVGFIAVVCTGVIIASAGEVLFNMTGFILQVVAVVVEASRLVMIQILVSGSVKVDALGSLYLYAPVRSGCKSSCGREIVGEELKTWNLRIFAVILCSFNFFWYRLILVVGLLFFETFSCFSRTFWCPFRCLNDF